MLDAKELEAAALLYQAAVDNRNAVFDALEAAEKEACERHKQLRILAQMVDRASFILESVACGKTVDEAILAWENVPKVKFDD